MNNSQIQNDPVDATSHERLRQERETFDQLKIHGERWFNLRLRMGYAALILIPSILIVSAVILFNFDRFPSSVVLAASGALFVDSLALFGSIWKIILDPGFMTRLAPVTAAPPPTHSSALVESAKQEEEKVPDLTIISAHYGAHDKTNDVAERLRKRIVGGKLTVYVGNVELGPDPIDKVPKRLEITYSHGGKTVSKSVPEYELLSIP